MITKKNKKLYILLVIIHLTIFNIFNQDKKDQNNTSEQIISESNEINSKNEDSSIINNNTEIEFEIYEPIISNCMQILDYIIKMHMQNEKTQQDILQLVEKFDYNKIQKLLLKYYNNIKKNKNNTNLEPIVFSELKELSLFLYQFILTVDKNIKNIDIDTINSIKQLTDIIDQLKPKNIDTINSINTSSIDQSISLIEELNEMTGDMIILTKNILLNLSKGKYINNGLYNNIFHPGKINKSKKNICAIEFQNEFLIPYIKHLNNNLQQNQLLLCDIKNIVKEIPENEIKRISCELLKNNLQILSTIEYFLKESKFYPKNNKFSMQDENKIKNETEYILTKTKEYSNRLIKKHTMDITQSTNISIKKLINHTKTIKEIISKCTKIALELTLLKIQNYYRSIYFSLEEIYNLHDITKITGNALAPSNWLSIFSCWIGIDTFLWLNKYKNWGVVQTIVKTSIDGYDLITKGGKENKTHFSPINANSRMRLTNFQAELEASGKINNIYHTGFSMTGYLGDPLQKLGINIDKTNGHIYGEDLLRKTSQQTQDSAYITPNNTELRSFYTNTPEKNDKTIKAELWQKEYAELDKKIDKLHQDNPDIHKIGRLINNNIINNSFINSAELLKRECEEYNKRASDENKIENFNYLNEIIKLKNETYRLDKNVCSYLNIQEEEFLMNQKRDAIGDKLNIVPGGTIAGGVAIGFAAKKCGDYLLSNGITYYLEKACKGFHYFMMGERYQNNPDDMRENVNSENSVFAHDIYDKTFDVLEKQGVLVWFKEVISYIESSCKGKLYNDSDKISKCIGLFGPSGSGKTYLARALANHIDKIAKESKQNIEVQFYAIDPKYFNGIIENGKKTPVDIISELEILLEKIRLQGGFYIIHLDEFHLFFTKDGKISQERLADLLKFFNNLFVKQKSYKRVGGMYVICSTNKPQFIPHEFFDNGDRIGEVVEIKYLNGEEMTSILKKELTNNNSLIDHIDFDYFKSILEGSNLTYGTIVKIVNKAFNVAKIKNTIINNEILYHAINDVVRKIILNDSESNQYIKDSKIQNTAAAYYGALSAVAINFNHQNNSIYNLDMLTILPIKNNYSPQHIDRLYLKPDIEFFKYGEAFYAKEIFIQEYDIKNITIEIIKSIAPIVYLDSEKIPKLNKMNELAHIYDVLYNFYSNQVKYADCARRLQISHDKKTLGQDIKIADFNDIYGNAELHRHIISLLTAIEKELQIFYLNPEVKDWVDQITQLLKENKIVTKKEIINNPLYSTLLSKINILFDNLLINISNKL